jgi:hypothetical protein
MRGGITQIARRRQHFDYTLRTNMADQAAGDA